MLDKLASPGDLAPLGGSTRVSQDEGDGIPHLAERLNVLFDHVPRRGGSDLYSNERAAEDLAAAGVPVTAGYLRQLRSGKRRNPTARLLAAIADLFEVPITYFFEAELADRIATQLRALSKLRTAGVRGIVARSSGLTAEELGDLGPILDQIRGLEGRNDQGGSG
jgi:transcriptional regulator with XRE-family HTH domain